MADIYTFPSLVKVVADWAARMPQDSAHEYTQDNI